MVHLRHHRKPFALLTHGVLYSIFLADLDSLQEKLLRAHGDLDEGKTNIRECEVIIATAERVLDMWKEEIRLKAERLAQVEALEP